MFKNEKISIFKLYFVALEILEVYILFFEYVVSLRQTSPDYLPLGCNLLALRTITLALCVEACISQQN